jgi:uncharacterized membrane protein
METKMKKCVPIYLTISASLFLLGIQFLDVHFRQTTALNFWTIMALVFLGSGIVILAIPGVMLVCLAIKTRRQKPKTE